MATSIKFYRGAYTSAQILDLCKVDGNMVFDTTTERIYAGYYTDSSVTPAVDYPKVFGSKVQNVEKTLDGTTLTGLKITYIDGSEQNFELNEIFSQLSSIVTAPYHKIITTINQENGVLDSENSKFSGLKINNQDFHTAFSRGAVFPVSDPMIVLTEGRPYYEKVDDEYILKYAPVGGVTVDKADTYYDAFESGYLEATLGAEHINATYNNETKTVQDVITSLDSRVDKLESLPGYQTVISNSADTTPLNVPLYKEYTVGTSLTQNAKYYTYTNDIWVEHIVPAGGYTTVAGDYEKIIGTLTATDAQHNAIYLVLNSSVQKSIYDEYLTINTGTEETPVWIWEKIGSTSTDLKGYIKSVTVNGKTYTTTEGSHDIAIGDKVTNVTASGTDFLTLTATGSSDSSTGTFERAISGTITMQEPLTAGYKTAVGAITGDTYSQDNTGRMVKDETPSYTEGHYMVDATVNGLTKASEVQTAIYRALSWEEWA